MPRTRWRARVLEKFFADGLRQPGSTLWTVLWRAVHGGTDGGRRVLAPLCTDPCTPCGRRGRGRGQPVPPSETGDGVPGRLKRTRRCADQTGMEQNASAGRPPVPRQRAPREAGLPRRDGRGVPLEAWPAADVFADRNGLQATQARLLLAVFCGLAPDHADARPER